MKSNTSPNVASDIPKYYLPNSPSVPAAFHLKPLASIMSSKPKMRNVLRPMAEIEDIERRLNLL
jgi:hypothetical protein